MRRLCFAACAASILTPTAWADTGGQRNDPPGTTGASCSVFSTYQSGYAQSGVGAELQGVQYCPEIGPQGQPARPGKVPADAPPPADTPCPDVTGSSTAWKDSSGTIHYWSGAGDRGVTTLAPSTKGGIAGDIQNAYNGYWELGYEVGRQIWPASIPRAKYSRTGGTYSGSGWNCPGATVKLNAWEFVPRPAGGAPPPAPRGFEPRSVRVSDFFPAGSVHGFDDTHPWRNFVVFDHSCVYVDPAPDVPVVRWVDLVGAPDSYGVSAVFRYQLTMRPGPIHWSWGDGTGSDTADGGRPAWPTARDQDCPVGHVYHHVSSGVVITVTRDIYVTASVAWFDGHRSHVGCFDAAGRILPGSGAPDACATTEVRSLGERSLGPVPVEQVEAIPVQPTPPS